MQLSIRSTSLGAELLLAGGRLSRFFAVRTGSRLDLLAPAQAGGPTAAGGMFALVPYSNRIRDATFSWNGASYALPPHPGMPHAMHGVARDSEWTLVAADTAAATLRLDHDGPAWPWPFRAEQRFAIAGNALQVDLTLENRGATPMPAGLGFHPAFVAPKHFRAHFRAHTEWHCDAARFPTYATDVESPVEIRPADWSGAASYRHFAGWDRCADLHYAEGRLRLTASSLLDHLVGFAPAAASSYCLEPVSHLTGALNAPPGTSGSHGLHSLPPGQSLSATLRMEWLTQ